MGSSVSLVKSSVQPSDSEESSSPKMLSSPDDSFARFSHMPFGGSQGAFSGAPADSSELFFGFCEASYAALALLMMSLNFRFTTRNASRSSGSLDFSHFRSALRRSLFTWWNTCLMEAYHGVGFRLGFGLSFLGLTTGVHNWKGNTGGWGGNTGAWGGKGGAWGGHTGPCGGNMGPCGLNTGALCWHNGLCSCKVWACCEIIGARCCIIGLGARTWANSCWNAFISGESFERIGCCSSSSPVGEVWETRMAGNFYSALFYYKLKALQPFLKIHHILIPQ